MLSAFFWGNTKIVETSLSWFVLLYFTLLNDFDLIDPKVLIIFGIVFDYLNFSHFYVTLKLVSVIFYQIFIFLFFISSKKLF